MLASVDDLNQRLKRKKNATILIIGARKDCRVRDAADHIIDDVFNLVNISDVTDDSGSISTIDPTTYLTLSGKANTGIAREFLDVKEDRRYIDRDTGEAGFRVSGKASTQRSEYVGHPVPRVGDSRKTIITDNCASPKLFDKSEKASLRSAQVRLYK